MNRLLPACSLTALALLLPSVASAQTPASDSEAKAVEAPRGRQEALKMEGAIREKLRAGDEMGVREALRHLRWKYPKASRRNSYERLTRSSEFGAATRLFVNRKLASIRKRLRAGDGSAWQEAHKLANFAATGRFERGDVQRWRWLAKHLRTAAHAFVRARAAELSKRMEGGDAAALQEAQDLVRLQENLEGNTTHRFKAPPAGERLAGILEVLAKGRKLRDWRRAENERRRREAVRLRRLAGQRRHEALMRKVRARNKRIEEHLARRRAHLYKVPLTKKAVAPKAQPAK